MTVLEISNVSVDFPTVRVPSLKEWAIRRLRRDYRQQYFHALRDVSLSVEPGRCLGIIGRNGAGKSTLLRVAAGVITPTRGESVVRGSVAPLIELGTGFDAELTGRENIFFNAALLGRSRASVRQKLDEIIDFSGLDAFIDAPLRTYSTGMVARLAFSIATTIEAELILLDEILAVGDAAFQQRCEERILGFFRGGSTIVLVSHDLGSVRRLCTEVVWLHDGEIRAIGSDDAVVDAYETAAMPQAIPLPLREGEPTAEPQQKSVVTAASTRIRKTAPVSLPDVAIVFPGPQDHRMVSMLLQQRLRELHDGPLLGTSDGLAAEVQQGLRGEAYAFVITDPRLVPSRATVSKLRAVLERDPACFAAVPVTNFSPVREQVSSLGRPYATQRQFDEATEWLARKNEPARVMTWPGGDAGAFLVRSESLVAAAPETPLETFLNGRTVALERTAYVHRFPPPFSLSRPDLVERVPSDAKSVLDLFCGDGVVGAALKAAYGCRVVGIEPLKEGASAARERLDAVHHGSAVAAVSTIDERFDAIVSGERFAEEPESIELLGELRRVCRPGGTLVLSLANVGSWAVVADLLVGRFDYAYMGNPLATAMRHFTATSIAHMLVSAGWQVVAIESQPHDDAFESRRLLDALDSGSVRHDREALLTGGFYVTAVRPDD